MGIGERVGNASMDQLLINLHLLGQLGPERHDLSVLSEYVEKASEFTQVAIPPGYPVFGHDAFRTATGVHAAAIIKAEARGEMELADRVYSSVPARTFGRRQLIEIGHYSGKSNVIYWLKENGYEPDERLVDHVFAHAKQLDHTLSDAEVEAIIARLPGVSA